MIDLCIQRQGQVLNELKGPRLVIADLISVIFERKVDLLPMLPEHKWTWKSKVHQIKLTLLNWLTYFLDVRDDLADQ